MQHNLLWFCLCSNLSGRTFFSWTKRPKLFNPPPTLPASKSNNVVSDVFFVPECFLPKLPSILSYTWSGQLMSCNWRQFLWNVREGYRLWWVAHSNQPKAPLSRQLLQPNSFSLAGSDNNEPTSLNLGSQRNLTSDSEWSIKELSLHLKAARLTPRHLSFFMSYEAAPASFLFRFE